MNLIPSHAPKFFARTALAMAISTVLWTSTVTAAGWNEEDPQPLIDTYYQSGYNYCDAMALSMWWYGTEDGEAVYDSKLRGGWKLAAGDDLLVNYIEPKIAAIARNDPLPTEIGFPGCYYDESGYTYKDAQTLACFWKTTELDAKLGIGILWGLREDVADKLEVAYQSGC